MKLGNLKPVKRPSRIRGFFSNLKRSLAGKYVNDIHPGFMTYIGNGNYATASIFRDAQTRRMKKLLKLLNSDKYRKFFFKAISYNPSVNEKPIVDTRWFVVAFNKIIYFLSKTYVFLFERELYKKIKVFERVSSEYADMGARVDKYIASTTHYERLSRMHALKLLSDESFRDDINVIVNRVSPDVIEGRRREKLQTSFNNAVVVDPNSISTKNLPLDVADLIEKLKK